MHVAMLVYPQMTQLDLTGPFEVLSRVSELTLDLVWKDRNSLPASGLLITPTTTLSECPKADILFVPGGPGQLDLMADDEILGFLRRQAEDARYVTSVCTGSLLLAAAGLLGGYRATCHWLSLPQLELFGATPVTERVVVDRNRVTGAGVTAGIDFALTLVAEIFGAERAAAVQLAMEYDPAPPFAGGSPRSADAATLAAVVAWTADFQRRREVAARTAAKRLE
jgi:cyclohexyl-isocyanide hydratase